MTEASPYGGLALPHLGGIIINTLLSSLLFIEIRSWRYFNKGRVGGAGGGGGGGGQGSEYASLLMGIFGISSIIFLFSDYFGIYNVLIRHHSAPDYIQSFRLSDFLEPPLCVLTIAISQFSFLFRAISMRKGGRGWGWGGVGGVAVLVCGGLGTGMGFYGTGVSLDLSPYISLRELTLFYLSITALTDLNLSLFLFHHFKHSLRGQKTLEEKFRFILTLGGFNALVGITALGVYALSSRHSTSFVPFTDMLPRISALSCVTAINQRNIRILVPPLIIQSKKHTPRPSLVDSKIDVFTIEFNQQNSSSSLIPSHLLTSSQTPKSTMKEVGKRFRDDEEVLKTEPGERWGEKSFENQLEAKLSECLVVKLVKTPKMN